MATFAGMVFVMFCNGTLGEGLSWKNERKKNHESLLYTFEVQLKRTINEHVPRFNNIENLRGKIVL